MEDIVLNKVNQHVSFLHYSKVHHHVPEYLSSKERYVVGEPVKKVNWSKIPAQSIKKDSLWATLNEKNCQNKAFFSSIKENFSMKTAPGLY